MLKFIKEHQNRLKIFLAISVLLINFVCGTARVTALDEAARSLNDIIFLSPACGAGEGEGGSDKLVGSDNIEKVLRYFVGKKLSLVQASAIVGNMMQESGVNPAKIQGGAIATVTYKLVSGVGFGLVQWTSGGRQQGLVASAGAKPIIDLGMQLDFVWKELGGPYKSTLDKLKTEDDPVEAAIVFHDGYESSADSADTVRNVRGGNAKQVYNSFKSKIPDKSTTADTANTAITCTDGGTSGATKYANNNFVIYNQRDPRWNDIWYGGPEATSLPCPAATRAQDLADPHGCVGKSGCGPSAMAMVITALTGKPVTPKDTALWGRDHGSVINVKGSASLGQNPNLTFAGGSAHNLHTSIGDHWKIHGAPISRSVATIEKALRAGGLVVSSGIGEAPWTVGGHFITIRGITASGKWLIADSNGKENIGASNSKKEWNPADIASRMGDYRYVFTK